jgi:uncharacterized protein (DUF2345 family)
MSGIKTQELNSSQSGTGGYNQLVFDDSAQANRIELSTTQANTRLQLGSLIQQTDNQRLELRGHGIDLKTDAHGAVRAGQGLLISADAAPGSASAGQQMESRAPLSQIEAGQELIHTLADTAQKHNAKTTVEPLVAGATKTDMAKQLDAEQGLWALRESLGARTAVNAQSLEPQLEETGADDSQDKPEDCSWLEQGAFTAVLPTKYLKRYKRTYTLRDTKLIKPMLITRLKEPPRTIDFKIHEICFGDGYSELIYIPVVFDATCEYYDTLYKRVRSIRMYTVEEVAECVAEMPQTELLAIDGFVLVPDVPPISAGLSTNAEFKSGKTGEFNQMVYIYMPYKGADTKDELLQILLHEGGHAIDERWTHGHERWILFKELKKGVESLTDTRSQIRALANKLNAMSKSSERAKQLRAEILSKQTSADEFEAFLRKNNAADDERVKAIEKLNNEWSTAITADKWFVSNYGKKQWEGNHEWHFEDFAEHCATYLLAYGTDCETRMRELMPNRAKLLDKILDQKPSPPIEKSKKKSKKKSRESAELNGAQPQSLAATDSNSAQTIDAWSRPDLMVSAPGGVLQHTPANAIYSAGATTSLIAGQDANHLAQGYHAVQAAKGIVMFTYGQSKAKRRGGDTIEQKGIQLHAASGNVNWQAISDAMSLTADKAVEVSSVTSMVRITAPKHILLTAGGAAIRIKGGNITLNGPGKIDYKAGMKVLAGAGSASATLKLPKGELKGCAQKAAKGLDAITQF